MKLIAGVGHFISNFLAKLLVFWREWNLRSFVVTSFTFQLFLILAAPFRKQSSCGFIFLCIWVAYLLADWVALQAVGFIPKKPIAGAQSDILGFWAQFLLVHLGGPDTITALALQDNDLWLRTGLHLGTQVYATLRILVMDIGRSSLRFPTILIFLAGVIKYSERIIALYCSQLSNCDEEPDHCSVTFRAYGPNDWDVGEPLNGADAIEQSKTELTNVDMVKHAYFFFNYYKGLYADRVFKVHEWQTSMGYFLRLTSSEVFKILEIELNFAYETFYTKMVVVLMKYGLLFRYIVLLFEVASLLIWSFLTDKRNFHGGDIRITNCLLIGAVAVDVLAILRIRLSYWNIARLKRDSRLVTWLCNWLLRAWDRNWGAHWTGKGVPIWSCTYIRRMFFRRWSESISQFNLINFCLDKRSLKRQKLIEFFLLRDFFDGRKYVHEKWFPDELRDVIFKELRPSIEDKHAPGVFEDILTGKDWAAWCKDLEARGFTFLPSMEGMEFDESLLTLHIATEICYQSEAAALGGNEENCLKRVARWVKSVFCSDNIEERATNEVSHRDFSKVISDYMLYLLIRQPKMMSSVAGSSKVRFRDTCAHLKEVLQTCEFWDLRAEKGKAVRHKKTCDYLLVCHDTINREGISESVLIKAVKVARQMKKQLKGDNKETWEQTAQLWVAVLFYAARHCKPSVHAARLKGGGEILTLVWLLSVHFGLGQPFT